VSPSGGGPALGVRWDPRWAPEDVTGIARAVEWLGYDELWMVEDCFSTGGLTMAALALAATDRLVVGIGLLPAGVRNPAIAAMEIGALARVFPGRLAPAFGHGVHEWMEQIDELEPRRLGLLEETVRAVRALLAGETLDVEGDHVRLRDVALEHCPATAPPVLVGTTGPKGLALAGRSADGVVIPEVACPAAVRWARGRMAEGAGAQTPGRTVVYAYLSLDDEDGAAATAAARPLVERWTRSGVFPDMAEHAGLGRDGLAPLDDATLRSIAAAGDAAACAATVAGLWEAGADSVVLLPRAGDAADQIARFAERSLPLLR